MADPKSRSGQSEYWTPAVGQYLDGLYVHEEAGMLDAVFVDANKEDYPRYVEWATRNLRAGGLVIGDNTYLFGRLAGVEPESAEQARTIEAMRGFHEMVARDYHAVTLPTPDGLTVG